MKKENYDSHAEITKISATSRTALRVHDNFYTVEASEERIINDAKTADMDEEWSLLFDELNGVVDAQCNDILDTFKKK